MKESQIQHAIVMYLQLRQVYFFSVPNEGSTSAIRTSHLKAMGLKSGVADLILLFDGGRTVFLEVKTEDGRQSDTQKRFEERVKYMGFDYHIVRSVDDVKIIVDKIQTAV